ncbi:long-chain-fatty-acid--CoA ligase [Ceratocystis lukuohia]|uniref:Long-chain-fatty-acid--CoA ligase n=1 Tax=Ceratocystis lukuohia TaxID=2019550 RepID=A0ABR4MS39_9PEZI
MDEVAKEPVSFFTRVVAILKFWTQSAIDDWSLSSTLLLIVLFTLCFLSTVWTYDSELHPLQLARQSTRSEVRQPGESALYRAAALGFNGLVKGLDVVDEGAPKFSKGRDGDLRDVWQRFAKGTDDGKLSTISTVLGLQKTEVHNIDALSRQISYVASHITRNGGARVAVYLPNSVELLLAVFACSFASNVTVTLVPYDVPPSELISMLRHAAIDTIVTVPGMLPFETIADSCPTLKHLIWVVDEGTSSIDWKNLPESSSSSVKATTWKDIVSTTEAPQLTVDTNAVPGDVAFFWSTEEMSSFTQKNVVSAIAAQLASIPSSEALGPKDTFVPADVLTDNFTFIMTMTAMFSNANISINSVAGKEANLSVATQCAPATVVVVSPEQLLLYHKDGMSSICGIVTKWIHGYRQRKLENFGVFPSTTGFMADMEVSNAPPLGTEDTQVRAIYVAEKTGNKPVISSKMLSDLRALTGARVVHALTSAVAAGSIAQSLWYDYRVHEGQTAHFGPPSPSIELILKDKGEYFTKDYKIEGEITIRGANVTGGSANTGAIGKINDDTTLSLV